MNGTTIDRPYTAIRRELELPLSYERFTRALEAQLGTMRIGSAVAITSGAPADRLSEELAAFAVPSGFALFQTIDHGGLLTALAGHKARAMTYVFGNRLIALEMTKHVLSAGLYVPLRLFVRELAPERIIVTFDVPSATLVQFLSPQVDAVAAELDARIEKLVDDAAELAASEAAA
jgi:hypothetical protein